MSDRIGVMSHGKLQQVASPRDIYNNPINGFVASFVGENNILMGEAKNQSAGMASFATDIGTFRGRYGDAPNGHAFKLYIRPEHMTLSATAGAENSVPVTISDVSFEGNFIAVQAKAQNGITLVAELRNDGSATVPSAGTQMHMTFEAQQSSILPDTLGERG